MAGIFTPRRLFLVNRLQQQGVALNLEESLTQSYHPLRAALTAFLTLGELGARTYIVSGNTADGRMEGFIQVRERRARPEADVLFIAPSLGGDADARVWRHLLTYACRQAGGRGVERLFARLPQGGEETHLFSQVGFSVFTHEDLFCLDGGRLAKVDPSPGGHIRSCRSGDGIALHQLYAAIAPRLVQQAENVTARGHLCPPEIWPVSGDRQGFVLERDGDILGCLIIRPGRVGHWLYVLLHPRAYDHADDLLAYGLSTLRDASSVPIYCGVREYQGGLRAVLEDVGFVPFASRTLMVKHTAVRVKDPAWKLVSALDKRAEATTPTVSPVNGHQASSSTEPIN
jgi:hypothetical protein